MKLSRQRDSLRQNLKRQLGVSKNQSSSLSLEDLLRKSGGRKKPEIIMVKDAYEEFVSSHDLLMKESVVFNPKF